MPKKILVINSNPANESFGKVLAEAYVDGAMAGEAEVQIIHLKDLKFDPILWGGDKSTQELEPDLVKAQELIKWAEHVVFVIPIWWQNVPALLKGFIDRVFLPGWAYKFTGKNKWDKYLTGKTAHFIITTGAPAWYYKYFLRSPINKIMGRDVLKFCGFGKCCSTVIGNLASTKAEQNKPWIEKIKKLAKDQV